MLINRITDRNLIFILFANFGNALIFILAGTYLGIIKECLKLD